MYVEITGQTNNTCNMVTNLIQLYVIVILIFINLLKASTSSETLGVKPTEYFCKHIVHVWGSG